MNSLNLLSSRVIGQSASPHPPRQRSRSQGEIRPGTPRSELSKSRSYSEDTLYKGDSFHEKEDTPGAAEEEEEESYLNTVGEKTPLLQVLEKDGSYPPVGRLQSLAQRIFDTLTETLKVILSTLVAPGVYVARCFREDDGRYSPIAPVRKIRRSVARRDGNAVPSPAAGTKGRNTRRTPSSRSTRSSSSRESLSSASSDSEPDRRGLKPQSSSSSKHSRSKSHNAVALSEDTPARRSIRIKLHNEDLKKRKQRRAQSEDSTPRPRSSTGEEDPSSLAADSLKSPTSPSSHKITKYPHAPAPPRPLIPPRQPSYAPSRNPSAIPQKTLVLDLDETLIHSLSKGGRMSSGHMVEVKLSAPVTTAATPGGVPTTVGPQHPILYYVHKRPHCDDFLRKVCKWYKLVVFTASVQEYAEPVIDWLERERKYFQGRYFRQHCTLRNGAYIKDLSSVEPDLSKVMILDNSPMSYIFHEDNAIPIEGWINDPTDNDLLHLIPMLEALQYVTDVRALLALRRGEAEA
ncbi:Nuclear envelope morphology protein 1 [Arachnomyces sp. PD_36]|nr:Nuclear envelope morphology protein 1 [Arachnomyces sp. PD_36]